MITLMIYPEELEIKETTDNNTSSSFLDLLLEFDNDNRLRVKIYDKRDDFNFNIVNYPFLCVISLSHHLMGFTYLN